MKLHTRLKKAVAMAVVATTAMTAMPVLATDYKGHWAEGVIESWKDKGIIDGYEDGTFKPKQQVTRAELAKMLVEVFKLTYTDSTHKVADLTAGKWYVPYAQRAVAAGYMTVTGGNFRPDAPATREEAAYALAQAYHITGESTKTYKDQQNISAWALESVEALVAGGYISGYPDGTFKPQGHITRAEMVTLLDRMTAEIINHAGPVTKDIEGNVVVNTKGVTLKDMTINGNLYLAEGIGEGSVTLDNVNVTGDIIVEGGGINTVHIKGKSKIKNILVSKAGEHPVRILIHGTATITGQVEAYSSVVIEGTAAKLGKVLLSGGTAEIKGSIQVKDIIIAEPTTMTVNGSQIVVDKVVILPTADKTILKGNAQIKQMEAQANGIRYAGSLTIDQIVVDSKVTDKPALIPTGGGGGISTPKLNLVNAIITMTDNTTKEVDLKGDQLKVDATKADGITINDILFTPDMQIASAKATVSNTSEVTVSIIPTNLEDVTLTAGDDYTIADLAKIVKEKEKNIDGIIGFLKEENKLTEAQAAKVKMYLKQALDIFTQSENDTYVKVSSIQHYIGKVKGKLTGRVEELAGEFEKLLNLADVKITEENEIITINMKLDLTGKDGSAKTVLVEIKF